MAEKMTLAVDLDGVTEDALRTVLSFGGEQVEIDLGEDNLSELRNLLSPYFAAGRPLERKTKQPSSRRSTPSRPTHDYAVIRGWAMANGLEVSERGRFAQDVIDQWSAA